MTHRPDGLPRSSCPKITNNNQSKGLTT
jgi:hypothetical protein